MNMSYPFLPKALLGKSIFSGESKAPQLNKTKIGFNGASIGQSAKRKGRTA